MSPMCADLIEMLRIYSKRFLENVTFEELTPLISYERRSILSY